MEKSLDVPVSRTWLESLSNAELIKLADNSGIYIPNGLERVFIIEELLEYSSMNDQNNTDDLQIDLSIPETTALPKQYNISFIEAIIRDPLWVFVYWEIKGHDRETHENAEGFNGYCLRIVPLDEEENELRDNSFTIPVTAEDSARYLGFAEFSSHPDGRYIVKLGALYSESEVQLAISQPFHLPRFIENDYISVIKENPLIRLSGVQDLLIIKRNERPPRNKRQ
jgi:hypothetical protein